MNSVMTYTRQIWSFLIVGALVTACTTVLAQHKESGDHHAAHVHGLSELLIVLDGNTLEIEFRSPAMNLLGFEHQASSAQQFAKIEQAKATLTNAETIFEFFPNICQLSHTNTNFNAVMADAPPATDHENQHEHGHTKDDHKDHSKHADLEAHYLFTCKQAGTLRALATPLLSLFPGIDKLEVQWIYDGQQGAYILGDEQQKILFR